VGGEDPGAGAQGAAARRRQVASTQYSVEGNEANHTTSAQ
jgi:hypothetical protein